MVGELFCPEAQTTLSISFPLFRSLWAPGGNFWAWLSTTLKVTMCGSAPFLDASALLGSWSLAIGKRQKAKKREEGVPSLQGLLPRRWFSQRQPIHPSVQFLHACYPAPVKCFPFFDKINHSSKNQPEIISSCLQVKLKFEGTYLLKIIIMCLEMGAEPEKGITRHFCSLSSWQGKLPKMNLERKAESSSPPSWVPQEPSPHPGSSTNRKPHGGLV